MLMPVLGRRIGEVRRRRRDHPRRVTATSRVLRYYDHVFPVRPGTEDLPLAELLDRQYYRLAYWRVGRRGAELPALLRRRHPGRRPGRGREVFDATHARAARAGRRGHASTACASTTRTAWPTRAATCAGCAERDRRRVGRGREDPRGRRGAAGRLAVRRHDRLRRAAARRRRCSSTPTAERPLTALYAELTGEPADFDAGRRARPSASSSSTACTPRSHRLVEVAAAHLPRRTSAARPHPARPARGAGRAAGRVPGLPRLRRARRAGRRTTSRADRRRRGGRRAATRLPEDRHGTLDLRAASWPSATSGRGPHRDEFVVRFQQTCGPVMAKGVEDTAFYRWLRLPALNEVGGDPAHFGVTPDGVPRVVRARQQRSLAGRDDHAVHPRHQAQPRTSGPGSPCSSELPERVGRAGAPAGARDGRGVPAARRSTRNTEYLLWQTLVGAWPIDAEPR